MLDVVRYVMQAWPLVTLTLCVDGLTMEAAHKSVSVVRCMVTGATGRAVNHLQQGLRLDVSAKRSVTVACRRVIARSSARTLATGKLQAQRAAKLLGTSSGGGRRRAARVLKVRMRAFAKRVPRIQLLRAMGIHTACITRATCTPMATYGADISGMANIHLANARRMISKAAAPQGASRRTMSFMPSMPPMARWTGAHVQPIHSWALAHWQEWQPIDSLHSAAQKAQAKVFQSGLDHWNRVSGLATAVVAMASRIGKQFLSGSRLEADDRAQFDLTVDPPIIVAEAVKRAVRRWRHARLRPCLASYQLSQTCGLPPATFLAERSSWISHMCWAD